MGYHLWWPFNRELTPQDYLPYAEGLKNLAELHGLKCDLACTTDLTRVLRVPFTTNTKPNRPPLPVELDTDLTGFMPTLLDDFDFLLAVQGNPGARLSRKASQAKTTPGAVQLQWSPGSQPTVPIEEIVAECPQMAWAAVNGQTMHQDQFYFGAGGVAAHTIGGVAWAKKIVQGRHGHDDAYLSAWVEERIGGYLARAAGPPRCHKIDEQVPDICKTCPWSGKVSSPLGIPELKQRRIAGNEPDVTKIQWDLTENGYAKKSYPNALKTIAEWLGYKGKYDVFHNEKTLTEGPVPKSCTADISDKLVRAIRDQILEMGMADPGEMAIKQALDRICDVNSYNPVLDYLNGLVWDGKSRLDTWLPIYLGAVDNVYTRAIGRKLLIAGVRRVRHPGSFFRYVLILEGLQDIGKSLTLKILFGEANFNDTEILHLDSKQQHEQILGVWGYELAELAGLRRTETGKLKAFLSREIDKNRMAYDRFSTRTPRSCIFAGTINPESEKGYLLDKENTRFWPVVVGPTRAEMKMDELRRDRDQLWAEAAFYEAQGESLNLDLDALEMAKAEQDARKEPNVWAPLLEGLEAQHITPSSQYPGKNEERILSNHILTGVLKISAATIQTWHYTRLSEAMALLGWRGPKQMKVPTMKWNIFKKEWELGKVVNGKGYWRLI
jgi:hypothetical protein